MKSVDYQKTDEILLQLIKLYKSKYESIKKEYIKAANTMNQYEIVQSRYRDIERQLSFLMELYVCILKEESKIMNTLLINLENLSEENKKSLKPGDNK